VTRYGDSGLVLIKGELWSGNCGRTTDMADKAP